MFKVCKKVFRNRKVKEDVSPKQKEAPHHMEKRGNEKYFVAKSFTERHIPYMQRMLNDKEKQRQGIMKEISCTSIPVTYGFC